MTVAAESNSSRADGGRIILSPLKWGVLAEGITENWDDHTSSLRVAVMPVGQGAMVVAKDHGQSKYGHLEVI